ncbi:SIR2-2 domain containing protein [Gracilaria domingensis]|nr:SIR2-2 domain containing protein [Gracilaria domingensis]
MPSPRSPSAKCGHVFLLRCRSEGLAADALLLPNVPSATPPVSAAAVRDGITHVFEMPPLPADDLSVTVPAAVTAVNAFFAAAVAAVPSSSSFGRDHPLLALPLLQAGQKRRRELIREEAAFIAALLPLAYEAADKHAVDVAVCTESRTAYAVMQLRREALCPFADGPFWMLTPERRLEAKKLADKARAGSLSIFFGAGVSYPSGLPSWGGLLKQLAITAGFSDEEREALGDLDYLDQPTLIEERMGRAKFRPAVAEAVSGGHFTPAHAMLAELRVPVATTNYDALFEDAAVGGEVRRLPWHSFAVSEAARRGDGRFITKLHGCVSHPASIVLTRRDYMRYGDKRQALRGVVHDMLLTTHVVFVGFSMTDDNLHLIIDEARECLEGKSGKDPVGVFGTILSLRENEMFRKLWDQDFCVVTFGKSWADRPAWYHDCFLDCVGWSLANARETVAFVLDDNFEGLLSPGAKRIKQALRPVLDMVKEDEVRDSAAWESVTALLTKLGADV